MADIPIFDGVSAFHLYWIAIPLVGFLLLLLIVAMAERRYSRPYVRVPMESLGPLSPYVRRMSDDAQFAGFQFGDYLAHAKPSIKICGTVWFSPDRRTLMATSSGTVSGLRSKQTFLFSPLNDGTYLCTTDNIGEADPSKLFRFKRDWNGLFAGLWIVHLKRLDKYGPVVMQFRESTPMEALVALYDRRTQLMADKGLARFVDLDRVCWRHSFVGALHICWGFFVQFGQATPQFWRTYSPGAGSAV